MIALPDWMALPPEGLSAAEYEALPEEVCRGIEIVDGAIVVPPAPRRLHQRIARRLAGEFEQTAGPELTVDTDVDLRLRDVPLLNRRPDVVIYDSALPDDVILRPQHCLLVVEVMSPDSVTADRTDKPAEYAAAGIKHFWRIESDAQDDRRLAVFRYCLDPATRRYAPAGVDVDKLAVSDPVDLTIDFDALF
ncbi:Uma2 family endonuclease [Saccharopolyspora sp. NPDC002376]